MPAKAAAPASKTFSAHHNHARMSPYKARPVIDLVRGKPVNEALTILEWQDRRSAPMIRKVIKSALANASNDLEVKLARLIVAEARIDGGPLLGGRKRFMPRAMGRAFPIRKRTCHIHVTLAEGPEPAEGARKTKPNVKPNVKKVKAKQASTAVAAPKAGESKE